MFCLKYFCSLIYYGCVYWISRTEEGQSTEAKGKKQKAKSKRKKEKGKKQKAKLKS